ncbi:hypothetical protein DV113_003659 [Geotrichum candidum]|nr:hypothetical protein DV454_003146 [Geotrichum candidum]KAF5121721.1 hypothetical protein DV452_000673 [Geotrichum candidum]KAF7498328.1 hypothetical protein DV113_003659 [Geotrichum candidum]KAI8132758.1 hypothetical protein DUD61_003590 [Geotrichum candidum]KAI9213063.1 hypothetical protein DS838_002060 [Geotrichum bryndzae]
MPFYSNIIMKIRLNPNVDVITYNTHVHATNIFGIISDRPYALVLDCTDNPATRYLVNDACVLTRTPLVSASALKTEGQLSVLNFAGGPCYRCLFPVPPPPNAVVSCGDGGILGPVVGIMGVHQAIEALKLLTGGYDAPGAGDDTDAGTDFKPFLTLFSAYSFPQWRTMKMRGRKPGCAVCGEEPSISRDLIESGKLDYSEFCGGHANMVRVDEATERVSVQEYKRVLDSGTPHLLVDVRVKEQFDICALPNSIRMWLQFSLL